MTTETVNRSEDIDHLRRTDWPHWSWGQKHARLPCSEESLPRSRALGTTGH